MRAICLLFLLALLGVVGLFAYQNQFDVTLKLWDQSVTASMPLVAGAFFLVGMLGGWTIVGIVRRSVDRIVEAPAGRGNYAYR
jgi:hypothetical protein